MKRIALVLLAMLLPSEGNTSGSSTVRAVGAHLAVSEESARKIFDRGEGEAEWHAEWRREHQKDVDAALAKLEPLLAEAAEKQGLALAPFGDDLPEARADVSAEDERSPESVCTVACRVRLDLTTEDAPWPRFEVEVAVAPGPKREALAAVAKALAATLAEAP